MEGNPQEAEKGKPIPEEKYSGIATRVSNVIPFLTLFSKIKKYEVKIRRNEPRKVNFPLLLMNSLHNGSKIYINFKIKLQKLTELKNKLVAIFQIN